MPELKPEIEPHEKIFSIIYDQDEITWQSLIYDLVKSEQMDLWNINVSLLTQRYIQKINELKEFDFRVSGKVLLAAAILLKIKSNRLMGEDLNYLDSLLSQKEEDLNQLFDEIQPDLREPVRANLIPRTPQPRKRKVSIFDLVKALEKALEVKQRKVMRSIPPTDIHIPVKTRDISEIIREVYKKIKLFFFNNRFGKLMFSQILPSQDKKDKVYAFIPLLHLTNQRKIDIYQPNHFEDFEIVVRKDNSPKN